MLVVIPVCGKDADLAIRNLELCVHLDKQADFSALITHDAAFDPSSVVEAAGKYFTGKVSTFQYDVWKGNPAWPYPQNKSWQHTARHIAAQPGDWSWFWWEADAVPIKAGWLKTLFSVYKTSGKLFGGAIAQQLGLNYMAGVAIYPHNTLRCTNALLCSNNAWDVIASTRDGILQKTVDMSALIHHTIISNTHFETLADVKAKISSEVVLFHKCKDGSLQSVLMGQPVNKPMPDSPNRNIPSFNEQTRWPTGYFAFPPANNTVYFNCSIADTNGGLHLFTRRWRYNLGAGQSNTKINRSDLAIFKVRPNMTLDSNPIIPATPNRYPHEQWEDPRAIVGADGQTYVAFATWVHYKNWSIRQSLTRLTPDWRKIQPLWEVPHGGNTRAPTAGRTHEKNWIWFEHDKQWHCQYSINPGEVFSVKNGIVDNVYKTPEIHLPWQFGLPLRGGTPPIRIGDEYLAFFHTATVWQKPKRRYHMGAYTFKAELPFTLTRITTEPLLSGSEYDFRTLGGPLVIFPNGALFQDGQWLVVFGVNDEACGWIRIPHEDLDELLKPVSAGIIAKLVHALK